MKKRGAFFWILLVPVLLLIGALVFLLAPGSVPETPAVVLPAEAAPEPGAGTPGGAATSRQLAVTPETVQTVIRTLQRADNYSRTLTAEIFWSGGVSAETLQVWVQGDRVRVASRGESSETVRHVLLSGREKWVWYSDRPGVFHGAVRDGDADAVQMLLTYEDVLALEPAAISDAGYTEYAGTNCIYVRYTDGPFGYVHLCYIAVETGLLMGEQSFDGDRMIYSMRSSEPDISTPDESLFQPPA
jgi:hypothetical protein